MMLYLHWRAKGKGERGDGPEGPRKGGIKRVKLQKLHFIKLLKIYAFSIVSLLTHAAWI